VSETYENMKEIVNYMNYKIYQWHIWCDLKVTAIFMGLQKGHTKFCYFLCDWDNHDKSVQHSKKNWPVHKKNVAHKLFLDPCEVLFPFYILNWTS
jgi:hypothetical protein